MSRAQRSRLMSRIRGIDTTPERYICSLLQASGVRFNQHDKTLPGKPDFTFADAKLVVYVDGDFWHGWRFPRWKHRLAPFWRDKIAGNRRRDARNFRASRKYGWKVMRIWEHQIEENSVECVCRILKVLGRSRTDFAKVRRAYELMPPLKRRDRLPKP